MGLSAKPIGRLRSYHTKLQNELDVRERERKEAKEERMRQKKIDHLRDKSGHVIEEDETTE